MGFRNFVSGAFSFAIKLREVLIGTLQRLCRERLSATARAITHVRRLKAA